MATNHPSILGRQFGRLTVRALVSGSNTRAIHECECICGGTKRATYRHLVSGGVKSCGCLLVKHGAARGRVPSSLYGIWRAMVSRCHSPSNAAFHLYGARGITVCSEWRASFKSFARDVGERPSGMTLDRVDNSKGYEPGNVRWATVAQQNANRRNVVLIEHRGEKRTAAEWARLTGISASTIRWRAARGYPLEAAQSPETSSGTRSTP